MRASAGVKNEGKWFWSQRLKCEGDYVNGEALLTNRRRSFSAGAFQGRHLKPNSYLSFRPRLFHPRLTAIWDANQAFIGKMDEAALARLERQRVELEGQIAQLRKSLRHWQTLEIDYEGLKEEFSLLSENCSTQEALDVAKNFAADLVDEQEIRSLFGVDKGVRRRPQQVVNLLSKRVDYVSKNACTIKKQLSDAEKKRNALLLAKEPDYREDAGLPLTEVTEELDNDGNVVSSKLETAQTAAPQLLEVLKKAGVNDLIERD